MFATAGAQMPFEQASMMAMAPPVPMSEMLAAVTALLWKTDDVKVREPDCRLIAPPRSVATLLAKVLPVMVTLLR